MIEELFSTPSHSPPAAAIVQGTDDNSILMDANEANDEFNSSASVEFSEIKVAPEEV